MKAATADISAKAALHLIKHLFITASRAYDTWCLISLLHVLDIRGSTGATTFARSRYSWFGWGRHFCTLVFLEASHFPRLGLIDFLLIILLISGYGKMCRAFDYFSLKFILSRTWGYVVNTLALIVLVCVFVC